MMHDLSTGLYSYLPQSKLADIPLIGYEKALHDKQCAFFWTLVLHALQSDLSYSCVLSHTTSRDGRHAFFDFVALHDRSKSKVYDTSIVMQHLLDIDLRTWKDTKVEFITQWFAQLEHLNTLRDPQRPLDFDTVKTHLCKACSSSFQLSEQFCKVDDPPAAQDFIKFRQHEAVAINWIPKHHCPNLEVGRLSRPILMIYLL
eukprot:jgi/Psemu1/60875/gm1.60875_g